MGDRQVNEWRAMRCPGCGRSVPLYRPYSLGERVRYGLLDGRVVDGLCGRCILYGPQTRQNRASATEGVESGE